MVHVPVLEKLTWRLAVPVPPGASVMIVGVMLAVNPEDGDTLRDNVIVPWKYPRLVTVIVD